MKKIKNTSFAIGLFSLVALFVFGCLANEGTTVASIVGCNVQDILTIGTSGMAFASMFPMSIQDLRAEAEKLSNYTGRSGGRMFYTGEGDDLLQFNGDSPDFHGELQNHLEKQFVLSLANSAVATRTAVLFAGYFYFFRKLKYSSY